MTAFLYLQTATFTFPFAYLATPSPQPRKGRRSGRRERMRCRGLGGGELWVGGGRSAPPPATRRKGRVLGVPKGKSKPPGLLGEETGQEDRVLPQ